MVTLAGASKWRVVDGHVECQRGHVIAGDADIVRTQGRRRCRGCNRDRNARSAARIYAAEVAARPLRRCLHCGSPIAPNKTKFCSKACGLRENCRISHDRHRAELAGVGFERIFRIRVYDRDGWACQLCGLPVSWFLRWPHDWSPVLDHRMPLSLGGDHIESNVQLAHAICNAYKRDLGPEGYRRFVFEQLGIEQWGLARA